MRQHGVGLVYARELEPLFECGAAAVLELEPQTLWEKRTGPSGWCYSANEALLDRVAALPQPKLLHGVGHPVGGSVDDPVEHLPLLRRFVDRLDPSWVSEHLSFNRVTGRDGKVRDAGFLLPPRQAAGSAAVAAHNIARTAAALGRPSAFETGVNYLRRGAGELDDGAFFAAVAERAQCGIVLDLHNLWCNERNGRQPIEQALAQLPLDRVWELHLAGGMALDGHWLDAHSGAVPDALLDIAAGAVARLPNLGAIVFEILPEHLPSIGLDGVQRELDKLHALWRCRPPSRLSVTQRARVEPPAPEHLDDVRAWEATLAAALHGEGSAWSDDPGVAVLRRLIGDARRASLVRALRYTTTALLAGLGASESRSLIDAYFAERPPDPFPAVEAQHFAEFLRARPQTLARVPYLAQTLAFEAALVAATLHGQRSEIEWSADPLRIFAALDAGRLPEGLPRVTSRMQITAGA